MTFAGWDARLLVAMGIEPTPVRLGFLQAWAACEGGTARNNPLNTTFHLQGATNYNRVGVKHYPDPVSGLAATMLTLRLPPYRDLVAALHAPGLSERGILDRSHAALATWGTGSVCLMQRLGGRSTRT